MQLRPYQSDAIDSAFTWLSANTGSPLIVLPTGTGKSLVIADVIRRAMEWDARIIVATHVKELVGQNHAEFAALCPFIDSGVFSAGLRSKNTTAKVLFVGIQSAYKKAYDIQRCDVLLIDEAHTVPHSGNGMWLQFMRDLRKINPDMRVVGLTATDYRLDSGLLTTGDDRMFDDVCYRYDLLRAVRDGYLAPVVPKPMETAFDISSVGSRGGDYIPGELERAVNVDEITARAISEIEQWGADRRSWLIFAAGNAHAAAIHAELARRGNIGACVTQETERDVRDKAVRDIKSGAIKYIVNNRIFTTGFNAPNIDLIADLGPTKSAGLHVQKLGRGMRLSPLTGKRDCLVLDFARNVEFHGPLDKIKGKDKGEKGEGDAPIKICPECAEVLFAGLRKCFNCGYEFPAPELDIRGHGGSAPILSDQIQPEWVDVIDMKLGLHKKEGKEHTVMKVTYATLRGQINEWICFDHPVGSFARKKAEEWHARRMDGPAPLGVYDGLIAGYVKPGRLLVKPDGKWWRVLDWDYSVVEMAEGVVPTVSDEEYYEIPF